MNWGRILVRITGTVDQGIKPDDTHEIDPLAARLGDPARRVEAAAIGI